jgi:hypothetical protein
MPATELAVIDRNHSQIQAAQPDPFEPQTWPEMLKFAEIISKTPFAPKDFMGKPEACAIAMLYGRQLGVGCLQGLQNVAVINGRPSVWGDLFWAIVLSHPELEDVEEEDGDTKAVVTLKRRGRKPRTVTFTQQDATTAGLWKKAGPWTNYPKTMLLWRARTICGKAVFADALKGITSSYEAQDYPGETIEGTVSNVPAATPVAQTTTVEKPAEKIKTDEAREFGNAWKARLGNTKEALQQAKQYLASDEMGNLTSSLDIPASKYAQAMRWARGEGATEEKPSRDKEICFELFKIIGYDEVAQAKMISEYASDWSKMATALNKELPAD